MRRFSTFIVFWLGINGTTSAADNRTACEKVLADVELRLKSIYDNLNFPPAQFPAKWLQLSESQLNPSPLRLISPARPASRKRRGMQLTDLKAVAPELSAGCPVPHVQVMRGRFLSWLCPTPSFLLIALKLFGPG